MKNLLSLIITGFLTIGILILGLFFLKVTVSILFYIFLGLALLVGIGYLYNKMPNKQ